MSSLSSARLRVHIIGDTTSRCAAALSKICKEEQIDLELTDSLEDGKRPILIVGDHSGFGHEELVACIENMSQPLHDLKHKTASFREIPIPKQIGSAKGRRFQ